MSLLLAYTIKYIDNILHYIFNVTVDMMGLKPAVSLIVLYLFSLLSFSFSLPFACLLSDSLDIFRITLFFLLLPYLDLFFKSV